GKTPMEALRCLKRRLSDVVYRRMLTDTKKASPGGQPGATPASSAADSTPIVDSSDKPQPGLAASLRPRRPAAPSADHRRAKGRPGPETGPQHHADARLGSTD